MQQSLSKVKWFLGALFIGLFLVNTHAEIGPVGLNKINEQIYNAGTCNGKYSELIYILMAPGDVQTYGPFSDYGYWSGGSWGGVSNNPGGYWVYVEPYWLVYKNTN